MVYIHPCHDLVLERLGPVFKDGLRPRRQKQSLEDGAGRGRGDGPAPVSYTHLISSELPEVIGVCDRVVVMHEGELVGSVSGVEINEENLVLLASNQRRGG